MIRIITLALCLSFTSMSFGKDVNGYYWVKGVGVHSCGKFISGYESPDLTAFREYLHYTVGVITGYNIGNDKTFDILGDTDLAGIWAFIEKHCRENPLDQFGNALDSLIYELYPNRTITKP